MTRIMAILASAICLTACSDITTYGVHSITQPRDETKHIVSRNYEIGTPQQAYVGAPIVRMKDYYVTRSYSKVAINSDPFTISREDDLELSYPSKAKFSVLAALTYKGTKYFVVQPKGQFPRDVGILITESGVFSGLLAHQDEDDGEITIFNECDEDGDFCFKPNSVFFKLEKIEHLGNKPLKRPGFINYELIYSGATKNSINLLYREYTPEDMARPAYTQNLTYDRASPVLRFRKIKIRVISADNQFLRYVVEADGSEEEVK